MHNNLLHILAPIARYRGPVELGWYDFIARFRRAYFGPLWITFQFALWIGTIALLLHDALGDGFSSYIVYLGVGYFVWEFLSSTIGEGPSHFTARESLLKNIPITLSNLTVRKVTFLFSRSPCQLPVVIIIILVFGDIQRPELLLLLLPLPVFLACFAYAMMVLLGLIGTIYRDTSFLMASIVRFLFFTSPVIWRGDAGMRKTISDYNPLAYFLELARAPIEGRFPPINAWIVVAAASFIGLAVALWVQSAFRNRMVYWL